MIKRPIVRILAPDTRWIFFHIYFCKITSLTKILKFNAPTNLNNFVSKQMYNLKQPQDYQTPSNHSSISSSLYIKCCQFLQNVLQHWSLLVVVRRQRGPASGTDETHDVPDVRVDQAVPVGVDKQALIPWHFDFSSLILWYYDSRAFDIIVFWQKDSLIV